MGKVFKITGYVFLGILVCLYIAFLFVLPKKIDLNPYKPDIQKLVKDNTNLTLDFNRVEVITSPFLEAGIKVSDVQVKLPDNSVLFQSNSVKGKVFLPALLLLSVHVTGADIESPKLNVEILNGEQFKAGKVYEDLVNKQRQDRRLHPEKYEAKESTLPFDVSKIKLFIPSVNLNNYSAVIDDTKAGHKLTLKGENLKLGYFNGKTARLKTDAKLLSDENTNITAKLDIDTLLPQFKTQKKLQNNEEIFALPFVNPVTEYRNYDLKSNIDSKIKIRQHKKDKKLLLNGYVNVDDTTVKLSGLQLPASYFHLKSSGTVSNIDTNVYFTDKEFIKFLGTVDYGKNPYIDMKLNSPKVHFSNIFNIARAYMDTVHIQNDIENIKASGYLLANASLKTDFKDIISTGKIIVREGNISDKNIGLLFNNMHANLFFDDNIIKVQDTSVLINNKSLAVSGKVDSNSIANFDIRGNKIPLPGLYLAFTPRNIKQNYSLNSGYLTIKAIVTGEIKDISALFKADLNNLELKDKSGNFVLSNNDLNLVAANYSGKIFGKLSNKGFIFRLPKTGSSVRSDLISVNMDNKNIDINKSKIYINKNSEIILSGEIKNYLTEAQTEIFADGNFAASDLALFAGKEAVPYFAIKGFIPVKALFTAQKNKMKLIVQAKANETNYITPVRIKNLAGKQTILQFILNKNGDVLKVTNSGIFVRKSGSAFTDKLYSNLGGANEVVSIRAMISNLSTKPFINLFKVSVPNDLEGSICIFDKSKFTAGGSLFAFGNLASPRLNGEFNIKNLEIPEIYTSMRRGILKLDNRNINVTLNDIDANGSDFKITAHSNLDLIPQMVLSDVKVFSKLINVDKLLVVSDSLMKSLPSTGSSSASSKKSDIPVTIQKGAIRLNKITTGNITANNTTGKISLFKNVFYLDKLRTYTMGGTVTGKASMNLLTTNLALKVNGKSFDVEKVLLDTVQMKDTLSGDMNFLADISLQGTTMQEQMKSLKGSVDFDIKNGQLGPFGKFENFLMAENIRENAFFSSTIGSVITNIATIDTSHFNDLFGHLTFKDGIANISPIKSQGNVMSMYIQGKMNLLDNSADMKVRAKLASAFSDKLGPLANINPVNLIKNTPGLNVVAAKSFSIFCEQLSEDEMKAIPHLGKGKSDDNATKFQIVLRGDTRKPLKMIKSFKWLALDSEIQSAQDFVNTIPTPEAGEEGMSVEELIKLREEQAQAKAQGITVEQLKEKQENKSLLNKLKDKIKK